MTDFNTIQPTNIDAESPAIAGGSSVINQLRLPADFTKNFGTKKILTNVPVGRPNKEKFFRVHPDPEMTIDVVTLELKELGETYVIAPDVADILGSLVRRVRIYLAVDRAANPMLIPVPLPDAEGNLNKWHASLEQALDHAKKNWIRISANKSLGSYDVHQAAGRLAEPVWPEPTLEELVEIAFRDRMVLNETHPIVHTVLGEV
jgi:hypothetical protein